MPAQLVLVVVVVAEHERGRHVAGQRVEHGPALGPVADVAAVDQLLGPAVQQQADGGGGRVGPAVGVAEQSDDHAGQRLAGGGFLGNR